MTWQAWVIATCIWPTTALTRWVASIPKMKMLQLAKGTSGKPHVSLLWLGLKQKLRGISEVYCAWNGFGGLGVACWPLVPKFAGSNPAEAVGFKGKKLLSTPSFGGEVKPSVPCRRFAACKRSLNGLEVVISAKLPDNILAHSSHFHGWDLSRRCGRGGTWWWIVGTSKKREKAMASYP